MTQLTYAVNWSCSHCNAKSSVSISTDEGCTELFARVIEEHRQKSAEAAALSGNAAHNCHDLYGDRYVAIQPPPAPDRYRREHRS